MRSKLARVAPLLFCSGLCALVYQTAWFRELRLIFGASTAASAAVLAIFMGGLGLGGALLGARADRHTRPLAFYATLETIVALTAAVTPVLVLVARWLYILVGGTVALGSFFGTVVRVILSALVLAAPTLAMGGTLPAAARAVESADDKRRSGVAILYGVNTLGAVTGAALSTFFLLEVFGTQSTLWLSCLVNLLVAVSARVISRHMEESGLSSPAPAPEAAAPTAVVDAIPPTRLVLIAAALVGFVFFLMEMVWYRMLAPLLGGSTFTFGLVLAVALFGIGLGGAAYAIWGQSRPSTIRGFALTCVAEAACLVLPYALGDRVALLALWLRPLGATGFAGLTVGWTVVTLVVVVPAAFVSGYQFPLLISLLGRGNEAVGRQVGLAYAWNTAGSIAGALAGGFGLLPLLTAPGIWRISTVLLLGLGVLALGFSLLRERRSIGGAIPVGAVVLLAIWMLTAVGPTAAWRHNAIGAGRSASPGTTINSVRRWEANARLDTMLDLEGMESSVSIANSEGYAFVVNGKSDGHAKNDGPTQVMGPMIGAILHGNVKRALVVGLGTGSSAGWLAALPGIERVDVVEIEPAILEVARKCAPVNQNVMSNPKVHVILGDAREVLLASRERYDLIASEPSNPYRAGISSLFTKEFYAAVRSRLTDDGMFLQWVQAYEIDSQTVKGVYATLATSFGAVETWQTMSGDMDLLASLKPRTYDLAAIRARVAEEPYRSALAAAWRVTDAEGVFAHFVAASGMATAVAERSEELINTDDLSLVEFAFARSVGVPGLFTVDQLRDTAQKMGFAQPTVANGALDKVGVDRARLGISARDGIRGGSMPRLRALPPELRSQYAAFDRYSRKDYDGTLKLWRTDPWEGRTLWEWGLLADVLATEGDEAALGYIEKVRAFSPAEADVYLATLRLKQGKTEEAAVALEAAFVRHRTDPWVMDSVASRGLGLARRVATVNRPYGERMLAAIQQPFSVDSVNTERVGAQLDLIRALDWKGRCLPVLLAMEPNVPWRLPTLQARHACYQANGHPLEATAQRDIEAYLSVEPTPFASGLISDTDGEAGFSPPSEG